jgi:hypothetical protein
MMAVFIISGMIPSRVLVYSIGEIYMLMSMDKKKQKKIILVMLFFAMPFLLVLAIIAGMHERWITFGLFLAVAIIMSINFIGTLIGLRFEEIKAMLQEMQAKQEKK